MSRCARPGCDLTEEEHHAFEARKCECDPQDWRDPRNIPPVCAAYVEDTAMKNDLCERCVHPEECHAPKTEPTTEKETTTP